MSEIKKVTMVDQGFVFYWARTPGKFVNKRTGAEFTYAAGLGPTFQGSISEWYETLVETIIDVTNSLALPKDVRPMITVSPIVRTILECSVSFRPNQPVSWIIAHPETQVGTLNNRFRIVVDDFADGLITIEANDIKGYVRVLDLHI